MSNISSIVQAISISAIPIVFAVVLHEVSHGWVANLRGDPTARRMGRLTLNPLVHIDLVGTIIIPIFLIISNAGFVFGWAKPVPVNFYNLRKPKQDMILVAAAGPLTNLLLATVCGLLFRLIIGLNPYVLNSICFSSAGAASSSSINFLLVPLLLMLFEGVRWNVLLAIFNMIPVPPLDGGRVMVGLLPDRQSATWGSLEPFGIFIVIGIFVINPLGIMSQIFFPLMNGVMSLIGGNAFSLVQLCR